jgi:hypothetical protein
VKPTDPSPPAIVQPAAEQQAELRAAFAAFEESGRKRLEAAILLGGILAARKEAVGHGNWQKWLKQHFPHGRERAADFIRVHRERVKCGHAATFEAALALCRPEPEPEPAANVAGRPDLPAANETAAEWGWAATNDTGTILSLGLRLPAQDETDEPDADEPDPWHPSGAELEARDNDPTALPAGLKPPTGSLPVPRIDAGVETKPHPLYGKNKNRRDLKDHKYGEILQAMANLSRLLTIAMNAPDGARLKSYLRFLGLVQDRGFIFQGKKYNARFRASKTAAPGCGFGFRHAVKIAVGRGPELTKAQLMKACLEDWEDEGDDELESTVPE